VSLLPRIRTPVRTIIVFSHFHRRPSLSHGKIEKYFNPAVKAQRVLYSLCIISLMILLVLGLVSVVFYLQYYITSDNVSLVAVLDTFFTSLHGALIVLYDVYPHSVGLYVCVDFVSEQWKSRSRSSATLTHVFVQVSEAWTPPGNAAVAIFSAVQIIVLNIYYSQLAINLNNQENHR